MKAKFLTRCRTSHRPGRWPGSCNRCAHRHHLRWARRPARRTGRILVPATSVHPFTIKHRRGLPKLLFSRSAVWAWAVALGIPKRHHPLHLSQHSDHLFGRVCVEMLLPFPLLVSPELGQRSWSCLPWYVPTTLRRHSTAAVQRPSPTQAKSYKTTDREPSASSRTLHSGPLIHARSPTFLLLYQLVSFLLIFLA